MIKNPETLKSELPIFVIDDHPVYGESLFEYITKRFTEHKVQYFTSSHKALETIPKICHDAILVMDIDMPEMNGIKLSEELKKVSDAYRIIYCSAMDPSNLRMDTQTLLKYSFVFKDEPVKSLIKSIEMAKQGRKYHSPRCREINTKIEPLLTKKQMVTLELLKAGFSYQEISDINNVSLNTTKSHLKSIYQKLDAENKIDCLNKAKKLNLFDDLNS